MKRSITTLTALTLACLLALAGPAMAQYPPPPPPQLIINTPRNIIKIQGTDWGSGTVITIAVQPGGNNGAAGLTRQARANDDGTFEVELPAPEGTSAEDVVVEVTGQTEEGTTLTSTATIAAFGGGPVVEEPVGLARWHVLVAAIVLALGLLTARRVRAE